MTFMRKLLDVLNMENWNTTDKEPDSTMPSGEEVMHQEEEERVRREEKEAALRQAEMEKQEALRRAEEEKVEALRMAELEKGEAKKRAEAEKHIIHISNRMVIPGLHIYFIDIAREIVQSNKISTIPLMREYHISENELNKIIFQIQDAKILDSNKNVLMGTEELEKFLDIYEPRIFECENSVFDKEIFMVMGEIIFDRGIEDTYSSLPADEVIDYLNIMESLKIISYDNTRNEFDILVSKEDFYKICNCIPESFSNTAYEDSGTDYSDADFDNMSGIEFEKYCAHILSANGFTEIKITPASGDHGIDILASKNEITYAIQCKCYSDNVGNAAVQQAHTGKSLYHKDIAVVMTNRYFTSQAIDEAKALGVKLWDRDKLNDMIRNQA